MKFWNFRLTGIAGLMMVAAAACGGNNATIDPLDTDTDADTDTDTDTTPKVIGTTLTAAQLDTANVYKELTGNAKCDVTVVQINYQTSGVQPEEMTNASAAVLIPSGPNCPGPFPLIAFSRGTKLEKAYTNADPNSADTLLLMTFFVSQGYAVVATDYLGYALSNYPYHPYMHANTEASAIIDSIRATRKAAASLGLTLNGKIMVAGYSQGGHAAMAAQRAIERDNADEFNLVAAAHLAGPYNVSKALIDGVTDPILGEQYFVPFQITSWQRVYGNLYSNASDVFNSPYNSFIESLLPAVIYPNDLGRLPPVETAPETARDEIFKPAYLTDLATNPNNPTAVAAKKQDLLGWNPQAPTTLCGGSQDPVVSFSINAQAAYDDFKSRGVSPDTLKLVDVDSKIEHMFGSQDRRTFIKNYHGKYELPFCYQVAKELFDQYKSPLSANNVNLIFVVSPDVAYNTPGDINPDTANLSNQGLQRSLWTVAIDNHGNLSVDNALCEGIDSESIPATAPLY